MKYEKENNFSTDYYECADSYSAYFSNKISVGDFCGRCAKADVLFCKLNDAPVVTLNDAVTV